jgi:hypothetical protein
MFQNSKEFTQLGTLAKEHRSSEYYQPDVPTQPKPLQDPTDLSYLTRKHPIGSQLRQESIDVQNDNMRLMDDKKQRGETQRAEEAKLFQKPEGDAGADDNYDFLRMEYMKDQFPATTNQEFINRNVHDRARVPDKTNFKRKNEFASYVNSMFNQGVFLHPWQDMC